MRATSAGQCLCSSFLPVMCLDLHIDRAMWLVIPMEYEWKWGKSPPGWSDCEGKCEPSQWSLDFLNHGQNAEEGKDQQKTGVIRWRSLSSWMPVWNRAHHDHCSPTCIRLWCEQAIHYFDLKKLIHNDQGIDLRRRYNNCKYLCTHHRNTSIHKANTNTHKRGKWQ